MTLQETIKFLEWVGGKQPNVNGIVESGDIYDLNKEEYQQKYSAFCVTQNTHTIGLEFSTFSFTLFYVDRLVLDKTNKIEIQSTAVEFFQNLMKTIMNNYAELNIETGEVTTFTERFSAECAGAYMRCNITTPNISLCSLEISNTSDDVYSNTWFNAMQKYIK